MKIVIDTNRIIAALISNGVSRKIIFDDRFEFVSPDFVVSEINKYERDIISKARISHEEFEILLSLIFEKVVISPLEDYLDHLEKAGRLIRDIKDVPFIALCLACGADGVWSDDKHFSEQNEIRVFKTLDMMKI